MQSELARRSIRAAVAVSLVAAATLAVSSSASAAAPANVQTRAQEITSGSVAHLPFAEPTTAGNLVVVYVVWDNDSPVTVSDSAGNSYASAAPAVSLPLETASTAAATWNNDTWSSQVFYAANVAGGATTVQASFNDSITSFADVYVHEYSGIDPASPLDASSSATGSGATMDSGSATTTTPGDLIFGAGSSTSAVTTAGPGFRTRSTKSGNRTADRVVSSAGAYSATATQNGSAWVMHAVAFKAAGPADTTPPTASVTSPDVNDTVSEIVPVTAGASDDTGVASVSFLVDGRRTGAVDTDPPYGLSWDTRKVPNGAHILRARARDEAGNLTTSGPVAVNVANTDHFQNEVLATGFDLPTTLEFLPDGRMLVGELAGRIEVLAPPYTTPSPNPFLQLTNVGEAGVQQGLYDIVLDPDFETNHFFYVFYTAGTPNHDRVSRFTANASLTGTVSGSEDILYEDPQNANAEHHGGSLNFANDGTLLFTTGEHFDPDNSQDLTSPRGKVHRINPDGTVPTDDPFFDGVGPNWDSVWASGLRNPYRAYYDAPTGRYYIADVGGNDPSTAHEEIDIGVAGANYGWPDSEGNCSSPCTSPVFSYPHNDRDAAITGGFVYHGTEFPARYRGAYFYADYTQNWIRGIKLDGGGNVVDSFNFEPSDGSTDGPYGDIVYLAEGPDGALYYVDLGYSDIGGTFGVSKIRRISYTSSNQAPVVHASASPTSGPTPLHVNFSSAHSSDPEGQPLTYSWDFGDGTTSTAANPTHTYSTRGPYQVRLTVSDGVQDSVSTPITINAGSVPTATILTPNNNLHFRAGDVISYSGDGTDPDDGDLPNSAFTWNIDFLHDGHVHPGTPVHGVTGGSFTIPSSGHDFSGNTRYRITLTVTDSDGLSSSRSVVVRPRKVNLTFDTVPSGRTIYLDGIAKTTPFVHDTLIGFHHTIEARNQTADGTIYKFNSWSDGGGQAHTITVPSTAHSYSATFNSSPVPPGLVGAWGFDEGDGTTVGDSSGRGHDGTLSGAGVDWDPAGKNGSALSFDGNSGNVKIPHASDISLASSYTLEAWVKPSTLSGYQTILVKEETSGCGYWLQTADTDISSGFNSGGCDEHRSGPQPIPLNQWSHLAAVFNNTTNTYKLYLNGTAISSTTETEAPVRNSQDLVLGQSGCSGCGFERWHGLLDDVRVYRKALSAAQIQADMANGI